jgi:hypothetical protein
MTDGANENLPQPPKVHLNQNLVIAIIGAVATVIAAVIPWALDRASQNTPTPTIIQATFTAEVSTDNFTSTVGSEPTNTDIPNSPTAEPPTVTPTPTAETGIFNAFLAFDFDGKFTETTFKGGQPIYVFFTLNDPLGKNIVRVIVSAVDVPGVLADSQFYNTIDEFKNPQNRLVVSQGSLKPGKYKAEILLNNILDETLEFTVTQ